MALVQFWYPHLIGKIQHPGFVADNQFSKYSFADCNVVAVLLNTLTSYQCTDVRIIYSIVPKTIGNLEWISLVYQYFLLLHILSFLVDIFDAFQPTYDW